jgi:putative endonuclease
MMEKAPDKSATRYEKGRIGEDLAADFLEKQGLEILTRNFRCPIGEIDLVGRDGRTLVFVEVKSRSGAGYGLPQESVSWTKQKRLTRLAQWYLKQNRYDRQPARFDVIAITWKAGEPQIRWIPNAFDARE